MNESLAINLINPHIRTLAAYTLKPEIPSVKLNQNENPWDWPAGIKAEIARFVEKRPWNRYPTFIPMELRSDLAAFAGAQGAENVLAGNGSNEMLLVLLMAIMDRTLPVITCQPSFKVYRLLIGGLGGQELPVMLRNDLTFNISAIIEAVMAHPKSPLIICSPHNPTGAVLSEEDIRAILTVHTGIFILDQAYVEFGGFNAVGLTREYPNLVVCRTFSKAFSGAGLRLGYMIGNAALINEIGKIKLPYNINFFSEETARVLCRHKDLIDSRVAELSLERDRLFAKLKELPFDAVYPSAANFICVRTSKKQELFKHLEHDDILVRDVSDYPMLANCLRISVGTPEENRMLVASIIEFFKASI